MANPFETKAFKMAGSTPATVEEKPNLLAQALEGPFKRAQAVVQSVQQRSLSPLASSFSEQLSQRTPLGTLPSGQPISVPTAVEALTLGFTGQPTKPLTPVQKLTTAIKNAEKPRAKLQEAYSVERSQRAGAVANVFETGAGQRGYFQALGKLKGELAPDKKAFEPLKIQRDTPENTRSLDASAPKSDNGAWPTTASKPSKVENTSIGNAPTGKEGVSAQRAGTSGPFEGRKLSPQQQGMREDALTRAREQGAEITPEGNVVLYHGTDAARAPKEGDNWRVGSYFTTDEKTARQFANAGEGSKPIVMRVEVPPEKVFAGKSKDAYWSLNEETPVKLSSPSIPKEGGMPKREAPFDATPDAITQADVDDLFNQVQAHPHLDIYEKITASNGLQKLFDGKLPQRSQLALLEDVFGRELAETVLTKRPFLDKLKDNITSVLNLPRTLITSLDMSAVLRQGILFTTTKPITASRAFKEMARQTFSQKNFEAWLADVPNNPRYKMMKDSGLYISDPTRVSGGLSAREEAFMTTLADKLPWVQASQRAYVSYLNKLRVDVFDQLSRQFEQQGIASSDNLKSLASFINHATGRGHLGTFERSAQGLNNIFFSPRLIAARFNMLNPVWYAKQTPPVRKQAIKTMAQFIGTGATLLALAKGGGAQVELDPRSTDFGKLRVGNTRWDIWGGFQQWVRVISQLASAQRKSAKGNVYNLDKTKFPFESRLDVAERFFRGKLNPTVGLALELAEGQKLFGDEITLSNEVLEKTIPLYLQDIVGVIDDVGAEGFFTAALPAFFGVGLQHYEERQPSGRANVFNP